VLQGEIIGGRYEIENALGQGGMAVVYRARHVATEKVCALKLLQGRWLTDDDLKERFLREARILGRIGSHPNIVDMFDAGMDEARGVPFLAMELLEGQSLREFLAARAPLSHALAYEVLSQVASALEEAHSAGIIHRDLKPANIFVSVATDGGVEVKVLDFGIAKDADHSGTATEIGTPAWSAPEQFGTAIRELAAERDVTISRGVSPQTDVWALGLLAYQVFTGLSARQYWGAPTTSDVLVAMVRGQRHVPSERAGRRAAHLPDSFDNWFLRCTRTSAEERWATPSTAVAALLAGDTTEAEAAPRTAIPARPSTPMAASTGHQATSVADEGDTTRAWQQEGELRSRKSRVAAMVVSVLVLSAAGLALAVQQDEQPQWATTTLSETPLRIARQASASAPPQNNTEPETQASAAATASTSAPRSKRATTPTTRPRSKPNEDKFDEMFGDR